MITFDAVLTEIHGLERTELELWIREGWVLPDADGFAEVDVARVRLIAEIRGDMGVPHETVPTMLSLLDQLYDARRLLRTLAAALSEQPPEVQGAIRAWLERDAGDNQPVDL